LTGTINLTGRDNAVIPNANLKVLINGTLLQGEVKTNSTGEFDLSMLNHKFDAFGEYNLTVEYAGNDTYNPTSSYKKIIVGKQDTSIGLDNVPTSATVGDLLSGTVNLTSNGVGVLNAELKVFVNGTLLSGTVRTNGSGEFDLSTLNYKFNTSGEYNLTVEYEGDDAYNPSNSSKIITVDSGPGPTPPSPPNPCPSPDPIDGGGIYFGGLLARTGFPFFVLIFLSVLGLFYWRRK
jgi:hypothetical protein